MEGLSCRALRAVAIAGSDANAQRWPSRPIEMIIPFPAGSGVDVIGRSVAAALSEQLGQQVVVNNRDGASGTIGFNALAAAAARRHTIAFGPTTPIANAPYLVKGVRYQVDSFDYVCQIFENVFTLAVAPQSKFKSAQELIAAARENPGKLTYGHAGTGTIPHLSMENFADALKLKLQAVPFRGDAPILPTLLKGDIDFSASAVSYHPRTEFPATSGFLGDAASGLSGCADGARARRDQSTCRRATMASTRPRDCRPRSRRRWNATAPMPSRATSSAR